MTRAAAPVTAAAGLTVRPLRRRHLPEVVALERRVHRRPWSAALFASEITQPDRWYRVALRHPPGDADRAAVSGFAGGMLLVDTVHVTTVVVDPGQRRQGVATRLLLAVLDIAVDRGATAATLEVRAGNYGAQRLYAAFGFAPVGVRPAYYPDTGEDAVIMWLHELGTPSHARRLEPLRLRAAGQEARG